MAELVIKEDGRVILRPINIGPIPGDQDLNIDTEILGALNVNRTVRTRNAFEVLYGETQLPANMVCSDAQGWVTVTLPYLRFITTVAVDTDSRQLTPSWHPVADGDLLSLVWTPPDDMRLVFCARMTPDVHGYNWFCDMACIFAFDRKRMTDAYALPAANLYDDGRICTGTKGQGAATLRDTLNIVLAQFYSSQWNDHLMNKHKFDNSAGLFLFDKDLKTVPCAGDWRRLCGSIGSTVLENVLL